MIMSLPYIQFGLNEKRGHVKCSSTDTVFCTFIAYIKPSFAISVRHSLLHTPYYFPGIIMVATLTSPPFPDNVPTHPLLVIDYALLKAQDQQEIARLWEAAMKIGFW